jgi:hypothetical protein
MFTVQFGTDGINTISSIVNRSTPLALVIVNAVTFVQLTLTPVDPPIFCAKLEFIPPIGVNAQSSEAPPFQSSV